MPQKSSTDWKKRLDIAVNAAKAQVVGADRIEQYWHAYLVTLMLEAFGDSSEASFFVESRSPQAKIPRPDLVLLHPQIGVLVIENKGVRLNDITSVRATQLTINRDGLASREDPLHQAERVMYAIRDQCKPYMDISQVSFMRLAALPAINRRDFGQRFSAVVPEEFLFADDCSSSGGLREVIVRLANRAAPPHLPSRRLSREDGQLLISVLTGHSFFRTAPVRTNRRSKGLNLGAEIRSMEMAIREPTEQQKSLGNADLSGAHRLFRGVAGSGKSVLLALNAAHAIYQLTHYTGDMFSRPAHHPRVLVLCFNRTLTFYLRQRIEDRYKSLTYSDLPGDYLTVTHIEGLIYSLLRREPSLQTPYDYKERAARAELMCQTLDKLPYDKLGDLQFDHIYVDEAQDLYPEELQLIRRLARPDESGRRTLILFYDNAQNIYGIKTPVWEKLGIQVVGRTIFLDQCLRNTKQIVDFAFNVLVGSYAAPGKAATTRQFADVANLLQRGLIRENGYRFEIEFCRRQGVRPLVTFYPSRKDEIQAVASYVHQLTHMDDVLPSDILILAKHFKYMDGLAEELTAALGSHGTIRFVDADHPENKRKPLFEPGMLTLCTVASAKGYDAPLVFVMGADEFDADDQGRASFYVACTRAKLALVITGVQRMERQLINEIEKSAVEVRQRQQPPAASIPDGQSCPYCCSMRLHAQSSPRGFNYHCIDCLNVIPIDARCRRCGESAVLKMEGRNLMLECPCGPDHLIFSNQPLACW